MKISIFCKLGIILITLCLTVKSSVASSTDVQVGTLSEGACWYQKKELLKVASFNDKTAFVATRAQIENNFSKLMAQNLNQKINEMDLTLHCGGYGASLVGRVVTTDNNTFCIWTKFENGKLALRSIGAINESPKISSKLCDGHVWGELIIGVESNEFLNELQAPKWSLMIKEVKPIVDRVYKVKLMQDFEFKESEVANSLEENFAGKNLIRYIEYNNYRHPVGEYIHLGK